jgi:hypothetical protein
MDIIVKVVKENSDGSAECKVDFDAEGMQLMIQWGLIAMLKESFKNKKYNPQVKLEPANERKPKASKRKLQK